MGEVLHLVEQTTAPQDPARLSERDETYAMPATHGQVRFWSLDQLNRGNPALNMPLMWRFTGPLDLTSLVQAFAECARRHEMLRTTFELIDGKLTQIISPPSGVPIELVDLTQLEGEAQRTEADRVTREHAAFRFDLERGPLLVLKMLRLAAERHVLLVTMHHIICDGISLGILLRDMAVLYEAEVKHGEASLPELPVQFADYAVWQEEWLGSDEPAKSAAFWRHSLGKDFSRIELPRDTDAVRALTREREQMTGDIETLLIPPALQAAAHEFCRRENVTLNILLFSVFGALMHRLTGQHDLVIGSPCANRNEETAEVIGLFMNIQVMRLRLEEGELFRTLLTRVQDWTLGAYEHQTLPFEMLVHDPYFAEGERAFQIPIFFLYQRSFMVTHRIGDLEIVPLRSESPGAVFEMMFAIVDRMEEGPRLQLEYNPRNFKQSTVQRYLEIFVRLLESALETPDARVDELRLLGVAEREALVSGWNRTGHDFGPFRSVSERVLEWAEREPGRVALECGGVRWTYAELVGYARRLAARLLAEGLTPGALVGIAVDRSPEMVGAVLAVMLAGGAYVPLDARHPRERLEGVLADAGVTLLIASRALGLQSAAKVLLVGETLRSQPAEMPAAALTHDSLAYVIYTSGSTGRPKGVAVEHGALINLLAAMEQQPGLTLDDTLVAITTLAFDIAGLELLLPLITGARLVVATEAEVQDGRLLLDLLERAGRNAPGMTVLQATPGAWRLLLDAGLPAVSQSGSQSNSTLRLKALCGGEALPRELATRLLERTRELWNMYGPTETTIWSSATRVEPGTGPLRLGTPIANTTFHVLDERRQLLPAGVTGELFIGGEGLARGYWNNPGLTREKFVENPYGPGFLYATGDLARRHDDGSIELLGRRDFQVKIRGYRIELAEIEAAIMQHPAAKEAVLTQQTSDATGVTRLAAYIAVGDLSAERAEVTLREIKQRLTELLPEYMIPTAYLTLPSLPRNTNGKIDRNALPRIHGFDPGSGTHGVAAEVDSYFPPKDEIERHLAHIWQGTLGIPQISVRASFFSLGVGSLAALRLITKMNRVFATDLGLASLISASTIESVAELIRTRLAPNTNSSLVPLQPHGTNAPLYIVHGVGGNVVSFHGLAMRMGKDQPVYGIQSQALVANQPALLRLKDMATHYIADIRTVQPHGPYRLLGYSFGGTVALEMAHQLRAAGDEVELLGMIDSKSKDYQEELKRLQSLQSRMDHRIHRFRGNTGRLSWPDRLKYINGKLSTRAIRFACMGAAALRIKRVPTFMRSAYDINYVAVQNYKPKPYDGKLVLFRASEQDMPDGTHDLGWSGIFGQGVEVYDLPGDHERIFLEPNIDSLAQSLRVCLGMV